MVANLQRSSARLTRAFEEEVVERWHSRSILYKTQEDKARTDRKEKPAEGVHGKDRTM